MRVLMLYQNMKSTCFGQCGMISCRSSGQERLKLFLITFFVFYISGCASLGTTFDGGNSTENISDSGIRYDCRSGVYSPRVYSGVHYIFTGSYNAFYAQLALLDIPLSFAMDTLLLPYTLPKQIRYGGYCDGKEKSYDNGQRIHVTYDNDKMFYAPYGNSPFSQYSAIGGDFVFSIILPESESWLPRNSLRLDSNGRVQIYGEETRYRLDIYWEWADFKKPGVMSEGVMKDGEVYVFAGFGNGNESMVQYATFPSSVDYKDELYLMKKSDLREGLHCFRYVGYQKKRAVFPGFDSRLYDFHYRIVDSCPFLTRDGRSAYFVVEESVVVPESMIKYRNNYIDEWIALRDDYFRDSWGSLIFMNQAYQPNFLLSDQ